MVVFMANAVSASTPCGGQTIRVVSIPAGCEARLAWAVGPCGWIKGDAQGAVHIRRARDELVRTILLDFLAPIAGVDTGVVDRLEPLYTNDEGQLDAAFAETGHDGLALYAGLPSGSIGLSAEKMGSPNGLHIGSPRLPPERRRERTPHSGGFLMSMAFSMFRFPFVLLTAWSSIACSSEKAGDTARDDGNEMPSDSGSEPPAVFRSVNCTEFWPDATEPVNADCGYVTVPQHHENPGGPTFDLAVARIHAKGAAVAPDPIVFLAGGPGRPTVGRSGPNFASYWNERHDIIVFDQRGVGLSTPSLNCDAYKDVYVSNLGKVLTPEDEVASLSTALQQCHDGFLADGIDLTAFTSAESARDLRLIVHALGYSEYNLDGLSYGSRLAQVAMRDVPDGIRSVVLDSTIPVESAWVVNAPRDAQYALEQLFAACAGDSACAASFPNLASTLYDTMAALDQTPLVMDVTTPDTGQPQTVYVTGTRYLFGLGGAVANTALTPLVPSVIAQTAAGNTTLLASAVTGGTARPPYAEGMQYSVLCSEEWPFITAADETAALDGVRDEFVRTFTKYRTDLLSSVCAFWQVGEPNPVENEPVVSSIPTLMLAGSFDPNTPPYYAEAMAGHLENSQHLVFPGYGHSVIAAQTTETQQPTCSQRVALAFFDAPTEHVDASCIDALPPITWAGAAP